jgi:hypothetical protein
MQAAENHSGHRNVLEGQNRCIWVNWSLTYTFVTTSDHKLRRPIFSHLERGL